MVRPFAGSVAVARRRLHCIGSAQQKAPVDDAALRSPRGAQPGLAVVRPRLLRAALQPARSDQRQERRPARARVAVRDGDRPRPRGHAARRRRRDVHDRIVERHLRDRRAHRQAAVEVRPRSASQVRQHRLLRRRQSRRRVLQGQVYVGVLDGRLVALDAASGKVGVADDDGRSEAGRTRSPARRASRKARSSSATAAPSTACAATCPRTTPRRASWRGASTPCRAIRRSRRRTRRSRSALPTWKGSNWWKYGGGGTVWDSIVYDPELNLLYVGTGNGSPWNRHRAQPRRRRQSLSLVDPRDQSRQRRAGVALPDDAGRYVGLHRDAADDARRPDDRRTPRAR